MKILNFRLFEASKKEQAAELTRELDKNETMNAILALKPAGYISFDVKSSGFIHMYGVGSKTMIYPTGNGGYAYKCISQGNSFVDREFPSLNQCLNNLYLYIISKTITVNGIKKGELIGKIEEIGIKNIIGKSKNEIISAIKQNSGIIEPVSLGEIADLCNKFSIDLGYLVTHSTHSKKDQLVINNSLLTVGNRYDMPSQLHCGLRDTILKKLFAIDEKEEAGIFILNIFSDKSIPLLSQILVEYTYNGETTIEEGRHRQITIKISNQSTKEEIVDFIKKSLIDNLLSITKILCSKYEGQYTRFVENVDTVFGMTDLSTILPNIYSDLIQDYMDNINLDDFDRKYFDKFCDFYKKNPLELYKIDGFTELQDRIMKKIGVTRQTVNIGRKLNQGLI